MGIPTLISTSTITSSTAAVEITSGLDSTYDEYMFVCTDIAPDSSGPEFSFQVSTDSGSNYNTTLTSTFFSSYHSENDSSASLDYKTAEDQAQGTGYQNISDDIGNQSGRSSSGILHLFSPSSTTYVKHFYSRFGVKNNAGVAIATLDQFVAGYFNTTSALDAISFKLSSGNFSGVVQMYGIA